MCIFVLRTNYLDLLIHRAREAQSKRMLRDLFIRGVSIDVPILITVILRPCTNSTIVSATLTLTKPLILNRINRIQTSLQHIELACVSAAPCKRSTSVLTLLRMMSYMPRIVSFSALSWPTTRRPTSTAVLGLCLNPYLLAVRTEASTLQVYCLTRAASLRDAAPYSPACTDS